MKLDADIRARLAARGIDPERSVDAWLTAIRDGSYPLSRLAPKQSPRSAQSRALNARHAPHLPGGQYVPVPMPLAVVIP